MFRVRAREGAKKRTLHLPGNEFIRRFLLHVLPRGFKRIRHYGLLGPAHKAARLASARAALHAPAPEPALIESVAAFMQRVARIEWGQRAGRRDALRFPPPPLPALWRDFVPGKDTPLRAEGVAARLPALASGAIRPRPGSLYALSLLRRATLGYAFGLTTRTAPLQSP